MAPDDASSWIGLSDAIGTTIEIVCDPVDIEIVQQDSAGKTAPVRSANRPRSGGVRCRHHYSRSTSFTVCTTCPATMRAK